MRLEVVTRVARLRDVVGAWEDLLLRCPDPQPMLSSRWLLAWWDVFGGEGDGAAGRELRVALFWEGAQLVGLVPLLARRVRTGRGLTLRRLELLASGEDERDEICSEYIGPVTDPAFEHSMAAELAGALSAEAFGTWDELLMPSMDASRPTATLVGAALAPHADVSLEISGVCPYVSLPTSWEGYLASLGGTRRHLVRRSLRDLEAWADGSLQLRCVETEADLARGCQVLESLHEQRWTAAGERSLFDSERFRAFHHRVMPDLLARGELELLWLEARGEPVAALYNVVHAGKVYFYQGGRRMDLPKGLRPGIAVHGHAIRRAIERGRREYDFLAGGARYKLDLATDVRPLCTLRASARTLAPRVDALARRAFDLAQGLGARARALLAGAGG